jgi:predicted DNA-binding protein (MmcQ/YjbR family)
MKYAAIRRYMLNKPEALEDFPFGPDVAVMKICGKMFATLVLQDGVARTNLKCDPEEALLLRDLFDAVIPGYHMNKKHWNTVILDGSIPRGEIERMVDNAYALVLKGVPKAKRQAVELAHGKDVLYPSNFLKPKSR